MWCLFHGQLVIFMVGVEMVFVLEMMFVEILMILQYVMLIAEHVLFLQHQDLHQDLHHHHQLFVWKNGNAMIGEYACQMEQDIETAGIWTDVKSFTLKGL